MTHSEQSGGFVVLLALAMWVGATVWEQASFVQASEPVSAKLQTYKLTGRDENGRQTLEYGYE